MYEQEDIKQGYRLLPALIEQHNEILNKLNVLGRMIKNNHIPSEIYIFKNFLIKHRTYKEEHVYPLLDEVISES